MQYKQLAQQKQFLFISLSMEIPQMPNWQLVKCQVLNCHNVLSPTVIKIINVNKVEYSLAEVANENNCF